MSLEKVKPPVLTTVGDREISTRGYSIEALKVHLLGHKPEQWCDVKTCCTRIFFQRSTDATRREMRKRLGKASSEFLKRGILLLKNLTGPYGRIEAIKIYFHTVEADCKHAREQVEKLEERGDSTHEIVHKMHQIMGDTLPEPVPATEIPSADEQVQQSET